MKTILETAITKKGKLSVALVFLLLLSSCHLFESEKKSTSSEIKKCLVVVKDLSASISETPKDLENQKKWIKKYLKEHFTSGSDIIVLMVNSCSSSAVNHKEVLWKKNFSQNIEEYKSETDKMLEENKHNLDDNLQLKTNQKKLF